MLTWQDKKNLLKSKNMHCPTFAYAKLPRKPCILEKNQSKFYIS